MGICPNCNEKYMSDDCHLINTQWDGYGFEDYEDDEGEWITNKWRRRYKGFDIYTGKNKFGVYIRISDMKGFIKNRISKNLTEKEILNEVDKIIKPIIDKELNERRLKMESRILQEEEQERIEEENELKKLSQELDDLFKEKK
jgi:DNA primase